MNLLVAYDTELLSLGRRVAALVHRIVQYIGT